MSKNKKILIVDDELDIVTYFEALFQDGGYDTITAFNGEQGFEIAKSEKPDLITLDITMPVQSGVRTYCQYKIDITLKNTPVIIITAADDSMSSFLEKLNGITGPEGFVNKPVDPEKLLQKVAALLSVKIN
ncbi:MAG: response regulator [Desulfobacterales bacterium]|nr:response regulator [Desulfobacterales bacterium]